MFLICVIPKNIINNSSIVVFRYVDLPLSFQSRMTLNNKMKKIYYIICFIVAIVLFPSQKSEANSIALIEPVNFSDSKDTDKNVTKLRTLIKIGDYDKLFSETRVMLLSINDLRKNKKIISKNEQENAMWLFYYIASAPMLMSEKENDTVENMAWENGLDIEAKADLLEILSSPGFDKFFPDSNKVKDMKASWATFIMNQFITMSKNKQPIDDRETMEKKMVDSYRKYRKDAMDKADVPEISDILTDEGKRYFEKRNPGDLIDERLNGKIQKAVWDNVKKNNEVSSEAWYKALQIRNAFVYQERRKNDLKSLWSRLETDYVSLLIRFYPNKASVIKKYLQEAGYLADDIPSLIDRTVGCTGGTEFLYKATNRKHGI